MTTETKATLNGIDVEALQGAISAITGDPAAGETHWRVRSEWVGGTRADHRIEADATPERLRELHDTVRDTSPNSTTSPARSRRARSS